MDVVLENEVHGGRCCLVIYYPEGIGRMREKIDFKSIVPGGVCVPKGFFPLMNVGEVARIVEEFGKICYFLIITEERKRIEVEKAVHARDVGIITVENLKTDGKLKSGMRLRRA